jgi:hypothetical protein
LLIGRKSESLTTVLFENVWEQNVCPCEDQRQPRQRFQYTVVGFVRQMEDKLGFMIATLAIALRKVILSAASQTSPSVFVPSVNRHEDEPRVILSAWNKRLNSSRNDKCEMKILVSDNLNSAALETILSTSFSVNSHTLLPSYTAGDQRIPVPTFSCRVKTCRERADSCSWPLGRQFIILAISGKRNRHGNTSSFMDYPPDLYDKIIP